MVTIVHGGPSAESVPSFGNRNISALASSGYFVFMPNPRGSFGQGERLRAANVKISATATGATISPVSMRRCRPRRSIRIALGLFGWSYGGYMGMWAETQTTRFKAIVAGAGIVNWQSYYGLNKIDQWMIPFFGASVYQDPRFTRGVRRLRLSRSRQPPVSCCKANATKKFRRRKLSSSGTRW